MTEALGGIMNEALGGIMWKIEIEEYNRFAQESFPAEREYFRTKNEALDFADSVKKSNCNCSIWITELIEDPECPDEYMDTNNSVCLQEIEFY